MSYEFIINKIDTIRAKTKLNVSVDSLRTGYMYYYISNNGVPTGAVVIIIVSVHSCLLFKDKPS